MASRPTSFLSLGALAALSLAGCDRQTSILVVIGGDLRPGVDMDTLSVTVRMPPDPGSTSGGYELTPDDLLPQSVAIVAGDRIPPSIVVRVEAALEELPVLAAERSMAFEEHEQVEERMCLYERCIGADDDACREGRCTGGDGDADVDGDGDIDADADGDADADADLPCTPEECDDETFCNGLETCTADGCVDGEPPVLDDEVDCTEDICDETIDEVRHEPRHDLCADSDPCTDDVCDVALGCRWTPRDADGDGHGDAACGGADCDDGNEAISPSEAEVCGNGHDDDCDGDADFGDDDCPSGDGCETAIPIVRPDTYAGVLAAGASGHEGSCEGGGNEVVYRLQLTEPSSVRLDTSGASFDSALYVRSGDCETGPEIGCDGRSATDDDASLVLIELATGTYYVFVDSDDAVDAGAYTLNADWVAVGCGNGFPEGGEQCDDGNVVDGDSCSSGCATTGEYALSFDGVDDGVTVYDDDALDLLDDFTVELRFRALATGDERRPLLRKGGTEANYFMWVNANGTLEGGIYLGGVVRAVISPEPVDDGAWHHGAFTFDGATLDLFLDGVLVASEATPAGVADVNDSTLRVGRAIRRPVTTLEFYWFLGSIDEVRISSTVRYVGDFDPPVSPTVDGDTVALWHFDDGTGTLAADSGPGVFAAILSGCSWEAL